MPTPKFLQRIRTEYARRRASNRAPLSDPGAQMSESLWTMRLRRIRDAAKREGLPVVAPKKVNVETVVRAVNQYIRKHARYTEDKNVRWEDVRTVPPRWREEMWASWAITLLREQRLEDDCDAYAWTAIAICLALGVPPERLAFAVVRSETARLQEKYVLDHAVAVWLDDSGTLRTLGDTWDQARQDYCVPVSTRHDLAYVFRMTSLVFEKNDVWFERIPRSARRKLTYTSSRGRPL